MKLKTLDPNTVLLVLGACCLTAGVALFDVRVALILDGVLLLALLAWRLR
jgi:hypothetical protein